MQREGLGQGETGDGEAAGCCREKRKPQQREEEPGDATGKD